MTTKKSPPTVPEQPPINPEPEQEPEDLQEDALAPEPSAKPRLDMDLINDYLTEVSESSSSDPATMATTAIRHFTNLLQLCQRLAAAVAYQTTAIQRLLDTDLAHLTTQSPSQTPTIPQWGTGTLGGPAFEAPQNPDPAFNVPWPGQEQPRPQTPVAPMAQPQGFGQPWQKMTPEQFMAQQAQQQAQQAQQAPPASAPQQDPLYQQWLAQQGQPQYSGPARNGQVIEARGAHGNLLDQISAPPPPIPSGFGGSPLAGGPKNNMRWDRV